MLTFEYGYRAPSTTEIATIVLRAAIGRWKATHSPKPGSNVQASLLSDNPLISYSGRTRTTLGMASHLPRLPRAHRAWLLISPTWSTEEAKVAKSTRARAVLHRLRNPRHWLIFMCNTRTEADVLRQCGEAAFFHNKTSVVSEETFRPVDGLTIEFDAIYNAQLTPWKRHELALGIDRCAFVFYRADSGSSTHESETALIARHARLAPGHVFINQIDENNVPVQLKPADVNTHLNRAAVGLCLSAVEGPMFASTEYLLAGLPVVTTPSRGGRDVYFDDEYCLTVPPDPRSIVEAVSVLKGRRIPRSYIRARTLERLEKDRRRFVELINAIFAEVGSSKRIAMPWPFRQPLMQWLPPEVASTRVLAGVVDAFADPHPGDLLAQDQGPLKAD